MENLTLESLPNAFKEFVNETNKNFRLLLERGGEPQPEADELLTIEQAAEFLKLSKATLYTKVHKAEIPVCKRSHRLYFSKHDLMEYIKAGRKKTVTEIEVEAKEYVKGKRK